MQNQIQCFEAGLKALSSFPPKEALLSSSPRASPNHHIMTSNKITFFPNGDDYIGTESCIDLQNDIDVYHYYDTSKSNSAPFPGKQAKLKSSSRKEEKREFPPPITLLARTQNLASHMPWVLKRYYTSDGRLILKEEKVRHHEYFRAHRANGRLTLQLVPLDDDVFDSLPLFPDDIRHDDEFLEACEVETVTSAHEEINDSTDQSFTNRFTDEQDNSSIIVADELPMENDKGVVGGVNGGPKFLNCNRVRSSPSCIFGVPVHPIRTVHG